MVAGERGDEGQAVNLEGERICRVFVDVRGNLRRVLIASLRERVHVERPVELEWSVQGRCGLVCKVRGCLLPAVAEYNVS